MKPEGHRLSPRKFWCLGWSCRSVQNYSDANKGDKQAVTNAFSEKSIVRHAISCHEQHSWFCECQRPWRSSARNSMVLVVSLQDRRGPQPEKKKEGILDTSYCILHCLVCCHGVERIGKIALHQSKRDRSLSRLRKI